MERISKRDEPRESFIGLRISRELLARIDALAAAEFTNRSNAIRLLILKGIENASDGKIQ